MSTKNSDDRLKDKKPLLSVKSRERTTGRRLYVNIEISSGVDEPKNKEFNEVDLVNQYLGKGNYKDNEFDIMVSTGPLIWTKPIDGERHYLVSAVINDKFAMRKVLANKVILDYTIGVIFSILDKKFSDPIYQARVQFIGHKFDSDFQHYEVLDTKKGPIPGTKEIVVNKIVPIIGGDDNTQTRKHPEEQTHLVTNDAYDIHYRPASNLLTVSVQTEALPESVSFNDDHIIIQLSKDEGVVDVYIPLTIDLEQPVKYKYDGKQMLFRAVFKVLDT